ncbi:MAG: hypothetical protein LIP03_13375 [Bacteroidales bacterium]|nr:hypothetical protein [Bacteroidales bacterium]
MTYAQALDYVSGHDYELVSVQDYYYNNFVGDSDYYEGQYARYSNGEISVYFKIDSDSFSIWLDTDEAFIKATTWLQREGYAYDSENSGEGARGQDWIYKKGNSLVSFWSGGGWFEGYNITIK